MAKDCSDQDREHAQACHFSCSFTSLLLPPLLQQHVMCVACHTAVTSSKLIAAKQEYSPCVDTTDRWQNLTHKTLQVAKPIILDLLVALLLLEGL